MLHGKKVVLRAIERDDLPVLWQINNDLDIEIAGGGDPPEPVSLARMQAEFDKKAADGERDGMRFGIEADGKLVGLCELRDLSSTDRTAELGITIGAHAYLGHGYGRDTVNVLLDYAFRLRNVRRVWLRVLANNERAIRCYLACGFIEEGRLRQHVWSNGSYLDLVHMGILGTEWEAAVLDLSQRPRC
ncbi:MAG: GNAT family N-acetyltransferase [Dehalococcoidia bacterium]